MDLTQNLPIKTDSVISIVSSHRLIPVDATRRKRVKEVEVIAPEKHQQLARHLQA